MAKVIGLDIGGTHVSAAVVDIESAQLNRESLVRQSVNSNAQAGQLVQAWAQAIQGAAEANVQPLRVGISMPGPFDYENGISQIMAQAKFRQLYGINIKQALADALTIPPGNIKFMNDAAAFLSGEMHAGQVKDFTNVLGLTLGTGLGAAFSIAGNVTDADLWDSPFKNSIAEDYFATKWFTTNYGHLVPGQTGEVQGTPPFGVKEILAAGTPEQIQQIFTEYADNMVQFVLPLIETYHLQAIVLGGNIANAATHFLPLVQQKLNSRANGVQLYVSHLQESAALIGAAFLFGGNTEG